MFSKTKIALATATFAAMIAAFTPAMANYASCYENPAGPGCPGEIKQNMTSHNYRGAEHPTVPATQHHHG